MIGYWVVGNDTICLICEGVKAMGWVSFLAVRFQRRVWFVVLLSTFVLACLDCEIWGVVGWGIVRGLRIED